MHGQAVDEDPNALQSSSDDMREKLLQSLLERRLKQFTTDVRLAETSLPATCA